MLKEIPISKLKPNPYRLTDEYPIIKEKVAALRESYRTTGYWGNVLARQVGDKYEIAYGHHRLVAMQEEFGKGKKVEIIVRKLSNEQMIQIMARENMEEWGSSAWVEMETVRATIDAYGRGEIELPKVAAKTPASHVRQAAAEHAYTKTTVAQFLGWTRNKGKEPDYACDVAFDILDMVERKLIKESDLRGLKRTQAAELIQAQRGIYEANMRVAKQNATKAAKALKEAESAADAREKRRHERQAEVFTAQAKSLEKTATANAKKIVAESVGKLRQSDIGLRDVRTRADDFKPSYSTQAKALDVEQAIEKTAALLCKFANGDDQLSAYMAVITKHSDEASDRSVSSLGKEFSATINRLEKMRKKFMAAV